MRPPVYPAVPCPPNPPARHPHSLVQARASSAYAQAGGIALEAITNIRTVAAHGQEGAILKAYAVALAEPTHASVVEGMWLKEDVVQGSNGRG